MFRSPVVAGKDVVRISTVVDVAVGVKEQGNVEIKDNVFVNMLNCVIVDIIKVVEINVSVSVVVI
jgi:hypothetical protein